MVFSQQADYWKTAMRCIEMQLYCRQLNGNSPEIQENPPVAVSGYDTARHELCQCAIPRDVLFHWRRI
jgi:hypothetical protein